MVRKQTYFLSLAVVGAMLAGAPAFAQTAAPRSEVWDPFERVNRATYSLNSAFMSVVAGPVVAAYRSNVPTSVQTGINNVFTNLREPLTVISSGVQGDLANMRVSAGRFAINTVAGIGGVFDVASRMGWVSRPEDLGTAMCSYGVPSGPYLMVPFFGPTNAREAAGTIAAYGLAYATGDDLVYSYVVADRTVAAASDLPMSMFEQVPEAGLNAPSPAPVVTLDAYASTRDRYMTLRADLCADSIPAADLKASPLGGVIKTVN